MFFPTSPRPPRATILQVPSIKAQSKAPTWRRRPKARAAAPPGALSGRRAAADKAVMGHTTLALFLAAAILVGLFEDSDRERARGPIHPDRFRLASAVQIAALIMLGPRSGALVAGVGTVAAGLFHGTALRRVVFDSLAYAGAACVAGLAFEV